MSNIPTTIYLIRHGEIDNPQNIIYGRSVDVALSKTGFEQMRSLGRKLQEGGVEPYVIYTSSARRAIQSAEAIRGVYGNVQMVKTDHLQDVNSPGLEQRTLDWLQSIGGDVYNYHGKEVEKISIEKPQLQAERIINVMSDIQKEHQGQTVFVVSHGDPTAFALWKLRNKDALDFPSINELKGNEYLRKGQAWRLTFDENGSFLDYERVKSGGE